MYYSGGNRYSISSPYDVIKSHLPKLVRATTDPERLANDLFAINLISDSVRNKVLTTSSLSQEGKTGTLLDELLRYLNIFNEHQTLTSFCDVLIKQDNPALTRLSDEISKQ